jgi:hypothetical protein
MKAKMTVYQKGGKTPIVPDPKKGSGTFMSFTNGRVGRTTPSFKLAGRPVVSYESMDTTGLAKGKENFVLTTSVNGQQTNKRINRKDVPAKIEEMKKGASNTVKYQNGGKMPIVPDPKKKKPATADQKFNAAARAREIENLNEMRRELKASDPDAVPAFDRDLKAKGLMVTKKPVKKMAGGGMMKSYAGGGKMNVAGYAMGGKLKDYFKKMKK